MTERVMDTELLPEELVRASAPFAVILRRVDVTIRGRACLLIDTELEGRRRTYLLTPDGAWYRRHARWQFLMLTNYTIRHIGECFLDHPDHWEQVPGTRGITTSIAEFGLALGTAPGRDDHG